MKIHARVPVVSVKFGSTTLSPISAFWEYPEDMKIYGISAATNLLGWSVGSELSYTRDAPAQVDGNDLLFSGLAAGGAVVPGVSIPLGPYGPTAVAAAAGSGYLPGYTRTNKTQFQLNTVKVGNRILGADQYVFIAEAGFQWNNLPDYRSNPDAIRYNRAFIFGPGSSPSYGGSTCGTLNISTEGCINDGYASRFAWGYRLKLDLTYNDVFAGVSVIPNVFWSHDVKGWSIDNQFVQERQALGLGVRFSYAKKYTLDLNATKYNRDASYDPLRDRDFYSAVATVSF